jgi:putative transferase (TIGR04331 family)
MFLATTGNHEIWDTREKIFFLGEWCKIYEQKRHWEHLDSETFAYIWGDSANVAETYGYCWDLYREIAPILTQSLNTYHNVQEDVEYYDIILGSWLLMYISQLFDKYSCLKKAFQKYPGLDTVLLHEDQFVISTDIRDFRSLIDSDEYMLQQYSQILTTLGYEFPKIHLTNPLQQKTTHTELQRVSSLQRIFNIVQSAVSKFSSKPKVFAGNTCFWESGNIPDILHLCLRGWPNILLEPMHGPISVHCELDLNFRRRALPKAGGGEFRAVVHKLIFSDLPLIYIEGFKAYRERISELQYDNVKLFYTANNLQACSYFKFSVAEKRKEAKICSRQHGGGYGTAIHASAESYERMIVDRFYTFGWSDKKDANTGYLPAPQMLYNAKPPSRDNGSILIPLHGCTRYQVEFVTYCNSSEFTQYLSSIAGFIDNLDPQLEVVIREYVSDDSWSVKQRIIDLLQRQDQVKFDDRKKNLTWLMERCRVVLIFQITTTYLQSLSLNKPTIMIISPKFYKFRSGVQELFDQLQEVGILHLSNESAAQHLHAIYDDVMAWWASDRVQSVRQAFVHEHARGEKNWVKPWLAEMEKMLRE